MGKRIGETVLWRGENGNIRGYFVDKIPSEGTDTEYAIFVEDGKIVERWQFEGETKFVTEAELRAIQNTTH